MHKNLVLLYNTHLLRLKIIDISDFFKKILRPMGQRSFLSTIKKDNCKILDVGCGNQSSCFLKTVKPDCVLYGIDVGDFNQSDESKNLYGYEQIMWIKKTDS
jgi:hypothetical protein